MNFQYFNYLCEQSRYDEIKVIGKDLKRKNELYHILGMTLKEKKVHLHLLEWNDLEEENGFEERTPRKSLKKSMDHQKKESLFLRVREFHQGEEVYRVDSASSGPLKNGDYGEAYFLFLRMLEAGWKPEETSPFYDADWDCFTVTNVELEGQYDSLPEWREGMKILFHEVPDMGLIEMPVLLETGKKSSLSFEIPDKKTAHCYINKVFVLDVWEKEEQRFADPEYKEKILKHVSEEEFEEMKKNFFDALKEHCPKGQCYMAFYYECDADISLNFYDKEYLDTTPKPAYGRASSMFMTVRPEEKTGEHGLKLQGAVIQKPIKKETLCLEAELYSYSGKVTMKEAPFL